VLTPALTALRLGQSTPIVAAKSGATIACGKWSVSGNNAFGTITASGVYTTPGNMPTNATAITATIGCLLNGGIYADTGIVLLNPVPQIAQTTPASITASSTSVTVQGTGFVSTTKVLVNGVAVTTRYIDSNHVSATVNVALGSAASVSLQVTNPAPGSASSDPVYLPVSTSALTVSPSVLQGGAVTVTVTSPSGMPSDAGLQLDGMTLTTTGRTATTVTATGFLAPWKTGSVPITMTSSTGNCSCVTAQIAATKASFDAASRFAMETGFAPREDMIAHIQQIGLSAFVDEQMSLPPYTYNTANQPRTEFLRAVLTSNGTLRERTAWAFQTFLPGTATNLYLSTLPWEAKLEADAFGSYRQILLDTASTFGPAMMLNLPGNYASTNPNVHPNQNFGREFLQLFSLGTVLLNEDGTPKLDASGNTQAVYDQTTIENMSDVFTGWNTSIVNPLYTYGYQDPSAPIVAVAGKHDEGSKVLFGNVTIPAGQTAAQDRDMAIDAVFQHPNLPPFVSRILIQRFVKSQPSPAYVQRVVNVFKDNGQGVRGDLSAVIKAILLDPEARAGDTGAATPTDGFVQDPLFTQLVVMSILNMKAFDDQPMYIAAQLGENWWIPPSVFSYFSPSNVIPGTQLNSPEFQLLNTMTSVQRSQFLWGSMMYQQPGIGNPLMSTLYTEYPTLPALVEALNHFLYHGQMPQTTKDAILSYCSTVSTDQYLQFRTAVFFALNDDNFQVVQ
jgi:uncharacterized protein (DUF1800 family)